MECQPRVCLEAQRVAQRGIFRNHWKSPYNAIDLGLGDSRKVICHDDRISQQARLLALLGGKEHGHATRVIGSEQSTSNHGDDNLGQSAFKSVRLDDKGRTGPCYAKGRVGK